MDEPKFLNLSPNIHIPLDGFTETTPLSHLTVRQFVELVVSVSSQLPEAKEKPESDALYETIKAVQAMIANRESNEPIEKVVERARAEIIRRLPAMTSEIRARSAKDGGASPQGTAAATGNQSPRDGGMSPHTKR